MSAPHADQLIGGYLARLDDELAGAPPERRREVISDLSAHIQEARSRLENETDSDILNLLDRCGDPAQVAQAAIDNRDSPQVGRAAERRVGVLEIAALVLTPLFWPVGIVLLWTSGAWNVRDKLIGTLVPPGGYLGMLFVLPALALSHVSTCGSGYSVDQNGHVINSFNTCPPAPGHLWVFVGILLALFVLLLPTITAIYLGLRLRRRNRPPAGRPVVSRAGI